MIRLYIPADEPQVVGLLKLNIPRYFARSEEQDFREYLDQYLESYFVVEEAGRIIGAGGINYFPADKTARLSWDMIHPDYQGQGIGSNLTLYRVEQIRKNPDIHKIVVRTSQLVYHFYQKMGFTLERTEKDFWAPGFDLYQMTLDLDGLYSPLTEQV